MLPKVLCVYLLLLLQYVKGNLVLSTVDGSLIGVKEINGELLWKFDSGQPLISHYFHSTDTVVIPSLGRQVIPVVDNEILGIDSLLLLTINTKDKTTETLSLDIKHMVNISPFQTGNNFYIIFVV